MNIHLLRLATLCACLSSISWLASRTQADVIISGTVFGLDGLPLTLNQLNILRTGREVVVAADFQRLLVQVTLKNGNTINGRFTPNDAAYTVTIPEAMIDPANQIANLRFSSETISVNLETVLLRGLSLQGGIGAIARQSINVTMPLSEDEVEACSCRRCFRWRRCFTCTPAKKVYVTAPACDAAPTAPEASFRRVGDQVRVYKEGAPLKVGSKTVARVKANSLLTVREVQGDWLWTQVNVSRSKVAGWISQADVRAQTGLPVVSASHTSPPEISSLRCWTSLSGKQSPPARLEKLEGDKVYFLTEDGRSLKTQISYLSAADQQLVRNFR